MRVHMYVRVRACIPALDGTDGKEFCEGVCEGTFSETIPPKIPSKLNCRVRAYVREQEH